MRIEIWQSKGILLLESGEKEEKCKKNKMVWGKEKEELRIRNQKRNCLGPFSSTTAPLCVTECRRWEEKREKSIV